MARYSTKRSRRPRRTTTRRTTSLNKDRLDEIVRRIVQVAQPDQVILFGSAARGTMRPDSDVDLLVVKANAHRRQLAKQIYRHLIGVGQAVDVIVVTPDDIERYRDSHALIIAPALREGKVIYAA
ncbi:MAG: nucleotidyltransferase domain-containing protein [Chloroflexi bacterium]|nr:nucleotidyltransferase domain-containing protein [Chloroflexota bacterium]